MRVNFRKTHSHSKMYQILISREQERKAQGVNYVRLVLFFFVCLYGYEVIYNSFFNLLQAIRHHNIDPSFRNRAHLMENSNRHVFPK